MKTDWKIIIDNISKNDLDNIINILNANKILTSIDVNYFDVFFKEGVTYFKEFLKMNNYYTGDLALIGNYDLNTGSIYTLYDTEHFSYKGASSYLKIFMELNAINIKLESELNAYVFK